MSRTMKPPRSVPSRIELPSCVGRRYNQSNLPAQTRLSTRRNTALVVLKATYPHPRFFRTSANSFPLAIPNHVAILWEDPFSQNGLTNQQTTRGKPRRQKKLTLASRNYVPQLTIRSSPLFRQTRFCVMRETCNGIPLRRRADRLPRNSECSVPGPRMENRRNQRWRSLLLCCPRS